MPHENSVMHALMQHIPWSAFDRLVSEHGAEEAARSFTSRSHLIAMLYAQLARASLLREIIAGQHSHAARLHHLGATPAARSTLSDANRDRPAEVFVALLRVMLARLARTQRRRLAVTADRYRVGTVVCVQDPNMKQAWCLAAAGTDASAKQLTGLYGRRWEIECSFRDTKDRKRGFRYTRWQRC